MGDTCDVANCIRKLRYISTTSLLLRMSFIKSAPGFSRSFPFMVFIIGIHKAVTNQIPSSCFHVLFKLFFSCHMEQRFLRCMLLHLKNKSQLAINTLLMVFMIFFHVIRAVITDFGQSGHQNLDLDLDKDYLHIH